MSVVEVPRKWDHEADVIIVGGGTAGLPAAIKVAEAGLKATVLETSPACGGSLNMIVGGCSFAGTDEQKEAGIDDSPDILCEDMVNVCGADPELARAYADNQLEAYRMLKEQGIKWPGLHQAPGGHTRKRGFGYLQGFSPKLTKAFENRARERGVEILFRHRATRLIINPQTGRVIGLKVSVKKEAKNFRAKRAVILTTGGFGHNRKMVTEYALQMADCLPRMPVSHQGDGLKMALDAGAATKDIGTAVLGSWPLCVETHSRAVWALDMGGITVNAHGRRFYNEFAEGYYGAMTAAGMRQPGGVYWVVFDESILGSVGKHPDIKGINMFQVKDLEQCKKYKANTIEELANITGINAEGLKETIDKYNSDIDSVGYDTVFGRQGQVATPRTLVKLTPPFYAVKCITALTSMKGGIKINDRCQVLNNYDEIIPGLYAGGEVAGGLHPKSYMMGCMTATAMAQGIICGKNAAKEPAFQ